MESCVISQPFIYALAFLKHLIAYYTLQTRQHFVEALIEECWCPLACSG